MDDSQNRPGSTPADLEKQPRPIEAPDPYAPTTEPTGMGTGIEAETTEDLDTKDLARQESEQVVGDARDQAQEVADTARQGAVDVAEEATRQAIDLAEDARQQLHDQARRQTDNLGNAIQDLGTKVHALADGRPQDAGHVDDYADRIADQVDRIGGRVQELGFDGTIDELQRFARRRPGMFLLGAAAAGFAVSRLGRGAKEAQEQGTGDRDPRQPRPDERSLMSSTPDRARTSEQAHDIPPSGQPPVAGRPGAPSTAPPAAGGLPSDVPPPPPAVPAPDPTMPGGRP